MALQTAKSAKSLSIELKNRKEWEATLAWAREQAMDWRAPFTLIGRGLFKWSKLEIYNLVGKGQFQDLSRDYKRFKQRKLHFTYPILRGATGDLEASLTQQGDLNNIFRFPDSQTMEWGTKVSYGIYHQSDKPRTVMPRRPFLLVTDARLREWTKIIDTHVRKTFVKPIQNTKPGGIL